MTATTMNATMIDDHQVLLSETFLGAGSVIVSPLSFVSVSRVDAELLQQEGLSIQSNANSSLINVTDLEMVVE